MVRTLITKYKFIPIALIGVALGMALLGFFLTRKPSAPSRADAPLAVVRYFNSINSRDQMRNASCAAWELNALRDFDSFGGVRVEPDNIQCVNDGQLVKCTGKLKLTYGSERSEIDVSRQKYKVAYEREAWQFCGYAQ